MPRDNVLFHLRVQMATFAPVPMELDVAPATQPVYRHPNIATGGYPIDHEWREIAEEHFATAGEESQDR